MFILYIYHIITYICVYLDGVISNINDFAKLMRNLGQNYNAQELSQKFGGND